MPTIIRFVAAASAFVALAVLAAPAAAQAPAATAAPSPSPTASPVPDPCGSLISIVNRPNFATGVCTIQTGHFDVENGYTNTVTTGPGGGNTATYPQTLIRVGTFDPHLDFEVGVPTYSIANSGGTLSSGWGDTSVGAKYELGYTAKADWGINGVVTIPTGIHGFTAGNAQFTGNFNWAYAIDSTFSAFGTLGFNAFSAENAAKVPQSYFAFTPAIDVAATLPGKAPSELTAEYAYFSSAGPNLGGKSWINFIYERDFGNFQFDTEYGFSPTLVGGQKQHYLGFGLSFMN